MLLDQKLPKIREKGIRVHRIQDSRKQVRSETFMISEILRSSSIVVYISRHLHLRHRIKISPKFSICTEAQTIRGSVQIELYVTFSFIGDLNRKIWWIGNKF